MDAKVAGGVTYKLLRPIFIQAGHEGLQIDVIYGISPS